MIRNIDYSVEDGVGTIEFFTWNEDNERVNFKLTQESSLYFENPAGKHKLYSCLPASIFACKYLFRPCKIIHVGIYFHRFSPSSFSLLQP